MRLYVNSRTYPNPTVLTAPKPAPKQPAPVLPEFPYPGSDSSAAKEEPSLPIDKNETPTSPTTDTPKHEGEAGHDKHSLPVIEKIFLTLEITYAIGLFIGVSGAATVAAPPAGIILIPASIGAGWAWWMIVSNIWRS